MLFEVAFLVAGKKFVAGILTFAVSYFKWKILVLRDFNFYLYSLDLVVF